ncbi:hypothetical protein D920_00849 [Enterococcus faecalis 13-SD-W-01]|nr:hypothetical protein D920_00849 [Enterococcus faecalis 13-SD-W-01]
MGGGGMLKKTVAWIGTISMFCQIFSPFVSIVYAETFPNQEIETILGSQETQKIEEAQENKETQDEQEISEETIGAESLQETTAESAVNQETTAETEHTSEQRNRPVPEIHPEVIDAPVPLLNSGIRLYGQRIETEEIFAELRRTDDRLSMVTGETSSVEISPNAGVYWRIVLYSSPENINLSEAERVYTFNAGGVSYLDERVQAFNSEFPTVKIGDILQIFHSEAASNLRWSNNGRIISTNENVAYFEITENGFELLQINHAIPPSAPTRLNAETSDEQLQNQAARYLNLSNAPNVEVVGFTTLPDRSAIGSQSMGTIQVQERLASGAYAQKEFNILFDIRTSVEATVVPQRLLLGQDVNVNQAIPNVQVDGIRVPSNQYRIDYEQGQDADVPGTRNATMTVTHIPSGRTADFLVPITVSWGETLLFRGHADRSAGALAYLPGENKLVARRGDYTAAAPIHPSFPDLYYSLAVLRNTESKQALSELNTVTSYEAAGNRNVDEHVRDIGTISIKHGDILKVYHEEPRFRLRIFNNETEGALSHRDNIAYLELTPTGYRQVLLDRVTPRTGTISRRMTDDQLDQQAATYLNLTDAQNVEVVGFTRYPDRSTVGQTTGTIQVQEKLSNGNYVQMTYDVPFTVHQGLEATPVAQALTLGETLDLEKVIGEVKYDNAILARNDYELEYDPGQDLDVPGSRNTTVTVVHKVSGERIQVQVPVTITWGHTVLFRGENNTSAGALAYLPEEKRLVARRGDYAQAAPIHPNFPDLYYSLEVLRNTELKQALNDLNTVTSYEAAGNRNVNEHVRDIGTISIEHGDILKVYHAEANEQFRLRIFRNETGSALSHRNNIAYLELTPTGYRQVLLDRVTPRTGTISRNMTDDQLDQQAASYLNLSNAPIVEVVGFTRYPDRSTVGQTTGTIQVQEKLSNGNYVQMTYDVPFTVHQGLEAAPVAQSLTLGESLDLEKAVGEVKYNNTVLARDAYELEYNPEQDLDVPGSRNTTVTIIHKASGERIQVNILVTITWGETLLFRGHADRSAGALAYLPGENKLVARRGDYTAAAPIHPSFPDLYYSLAVLRNTESKQALSELNTVTSYEAAGNRNVNDHVRDIGTISITHGDILKVYHEEPNFRLRIFNNEVEGALSHRNNIAYLELTPTGYRQVLLDRVTPRTGTISRNMTDKQLDQQAASYLNLTGTPTVEVVGFTRYPDRSTVGQTTGTIQVQEKLSNGNYVQMTYDVPFTVTVGLEASAVAQTLNLGETLDPSQVVENVKYNSQPLSTNDFEVKISGNGIMNLVGSRTINASITHKATTETIEVEIPVNIQWGNTLLLKGTSRHESLGLSLIRAGNQLQLIGTKGSEDRNLQLHTGLFLDTAYLKIGLISGQQNIALNLPNYQRNFTYYGRDYKFDIIDDFGVNTVQVGDVVEVYHQESLSAGRMISLYTDGVEADIHPTNRLVNQTTYYETTNDGLSLLFINQLTPKNATISQTMSDHQLDAAAETYLEFGSAKNVEVVGFTRYPDRTTVGQTTGTIQVQEKLSNGNFIQKEYEIPFTVQGVRMLTDVPAFDFGTIQKSSFSQTISAKTENQTSLSLQLADFIGENNWSLQVYQSPFQDSQGNSLKGAGITLNNISVKSDQENALHFPESLVLDTQPTELLSYQAPNAGNDVMRGYTNIYFGNEGTAGVHLNIPSTTLANEDTYKTTISWELVADPSQGANQYDE